VNSQEPNEPRGWLLLLLLLVVLAGIYAPTLGAPLVWDDSRLILESPAIRSLDLRHAFLEPFWFGVPGEAGSAAFFRPLSSLSLGLDYHIHGDNPAGYHLSNVVFHLLSTSTLFALLRRRGSRASAAVVLTLCWACLPRLTEGVAWISGRGDVLAGMFTLFSLLAYRAGSLPRLALAGVLALCAVLSKESGLAAFAALGVLELARRRADPKQAASALGWLCLGLPALIYGALRLNAGASAGDGLPLPPGLHAWAILEALGRYAGMLLDPFQPRTFMGRIGKPDFAFVALGGLVVVSGVWLAGRLRYASAETRAFTLLGVLPLLLVVHVLRLPVMVVASDRYLYLPTLGLLLAAAPSLARAFELRRWLVGVAVAFGVACAVRTVSRVGDYEEVATFWMAAARGAPREAMPLVELGSAAYRAGCFPEAADFYERALALHDLATPRAVENAALLASVTGKHEQAARLGDVLLQRFPGVAALELRRATIALSALDFEAARVHGVRAAELDHDFKQARGFLHMLVEVRSVWQRVEAGELPLEARLGVEMRALRYPEVVESLRRLLEQPAVDDATLRSGLDFVLRVGTPEDARELFGRYLAQHTPRDRAELGAAVRQRVETAENLRRRLRELPR
jgi:tetratricopeptide (TPR) repeat protein